jgi:threonine aldolase
LATICGIDLDPGRVQTNIIIFSIKPSGSRSSAILGRLAARGVLADALDDHRIRVVTHYGIEDAHVDRALASIAATMRE